MESDFAVLKSACMCCGIYGLPRANLRVPGELPTSQNICKPCSNHQGSEARDLNKRNVEHIAAWRSHTTEEITKLAQTHGREIDRLIDQINQKNEELEQRPVQIVHENLDQEIVDEALAQQGIAWQHRDRAFGLLSRIRALHRDKGDGNCRCGISLTKCNIRDMLSHDQVLVKWEGKQLERLRRGEPHSFPFGHLALMDPRWVPEG
jgi:hypothetical protein